MKLQSFLPKAQSGFQEDTSSAWIQTQAMWLPSHTLCSQPWMMSQVVVTMLTTLSELWIKFYMHGPIWSSKKTPCGFMTTSSKRSWRSLTNYWCYLYVFENGVQNIYVCMNTYELCQSGFSRETINKTYNWPFLFSGAMLKDPINCESKIFENKIVSILILPSFPKHYSILTIYTAFIQY